MNYKKIGIILAIFFVMIVAFTTVLKQRSKHLLTKALLSSGAVFDYQDVSVNVMRDFPNLQLEMYGLKLTQTADYEYEIDTLLATMSMANVFANELSISSLQLKHPQVQMTDLSSEASMPSDGKVHVEEATAFPFKYTLDQLVITNGRFQYQFADSSYWVLRGIDATVKAEMSKEHSFVDLSTRIVAFDYNTEELALIGIPLGAQLKLNYANEVLQVQSGTFELANIVHQLSGNVKLSSAPDFDLKFESKEATAKSLLSLMSQVAWQDTGLVVTGSLRSQGILKGTYRGAHSWPEFALNLETSDASLAFQNQASKIEKIAVHALFSHPEGTPMDSMVLLLDQMALRSNDNYLKGKIEMRDLVSSPSIKAQLNGDVDLADMVEVFPIQGTVLRGKVHTDVNMSGKLEDISQENYQAFVADGQVSMQGFYLNNKNFPQGLRINNAAFDFSPASIRLQSFVGQLGHSDLNLQGAFYNYISYLFDDEDLEGNLVLNSSYLDLNEFRKEPERAKTSMSKGESTPFMVPRGLNLVLTTNIHTLKLDGSLLEQCKGLVALKEQRLHLKNLSFNTLGGAVTLTGSYDTRKRNQLKSNLNIDARGIDIARATTSISALRRSAPLSQMAKGKVSSQMSYYGEMDEKGTLDINTMKAKGLIQSHGLHFSNHPSLNQLATQLKDKRYRNFTTSPFSINFDMHNGQLDISPFEVKMVDKNIKAGGWYRIDNTINFSVKTTVKAKEIGGDVSKYVAMLSDANKPLPVTVKLTGDAKDPTIKYDTREAINILRKDVTKNLNNDAVKSVLKGFFN